MSTPVSWIRRDTEWFSDHIATKKGKCFWYQIYTCAKWAGSGGHQNFYTVEMCSRKSEDILKRHTGHRDGDTFIIKAETSAAYYIYIHINFLI